MASALGHKEGFHQNEVDGFNIFLDILLTDTRTDGRTDGQTHH